MSYSIKIVYYKFKQPTKARSPSRWSHKINIKRTSIQISQFFRGQNTDSCSQCAFGFPYHFPHFSNWKRLALECNGIRIFRVFTVILLFCWSILNTFVSDTSLLVDGPLSIGSHRLLYGILRSISHSATLFGSPERRGRQVDFAVTRDSVHLCWWSSQTILWKHWDQRLVECRRVDTKGHEGNFSKIPSCP